MLLLLTTTHRISVQDCDWLVKLAQGQRCLVRGSFFEARKLRLKAGLPPGGNMLSRSLNNLSYFANSCLIDLPKILARSDHGGI